jgi:hypothetical protein
MEPSITSEGGGPPKRSRVYLWAAGLATLVLLSTFYLSKSHSLSEPQVRDRAMQYMSQARPSVTYRLSGVLKQPDGH